MKIDLSQFRRVYLQESAEHVIAMEAGLLLLRSTPQDTELLNAIFRSAHSIKGGAGTFGLTHLVQVTHALENLLDLLRSMTVTVTEAVIAVLLESVDVLRALLDPGEQNQDAGEIQNAPLPPSAAELLRHIEAIVGSQEEAPQNVASATRNPDHPSENSGGSVYTIAIRPSRQMFSSGADPVVLIRNLAAMGTLRGCHLDLKELPPLGDLDPDQCYLNWTVELLTSHPEHELREVFEFVEHLAEITIRPAIVTRKPADRRTNPRRTTTRRSEEKKPAAGVETSIRVSTDKVDRLIDLVGELVIAQVMTAQMVEDFTPACLPRLREAVAAMERNTRTLHERVMAVRMMPVATLFQRYARTVYDIAQATGKQIRLDISGEETEVDKSMLEQLGDPLTHLIRNSADHGVEAPEQRAAAGKPEEGTISLRAFHRSGRVVMEVSDDGAGVDTVRVFAKAVERGLIPADAHLTDSQINLLIFEPGFSTRDQVNDLSGRGVGMDVVKRNVQQLSGTVSMVSQLGSGSTVSIELPLTLAILDGLLVRVADRTLVLPLLTVVETVSPAAGQVTRIAGQGEVVVIREESIPLLMLHRFLDVPEPVSSGAGSHGLIIVVEAGRNKIGLVVDELLGQQQVVVKSLERNLHRVEGLMGATILGDGCVAPILDIAVLATMDLFSPRRSSFARPPRTAQSPQLQAS